MLAGAQVLPVFVNSSIHPLQLLVALQAKCPLDGSKWYVCLVDCSELSDKIDYFHFDRRPFHSTGLIVRVAHVTCGPLNDPGCLVQRIIAGPF